MAKHPRGMIDASVLVDIDQLKADALPNEIAISAITLAELAASPHATNDPMVRAQRQEQLQRV